MTTTRKQTNHNTEKDLYLKRCIDKANFYGGECLSAEFINSRTKLLWKCHNPAHEPWEDIYSKVVHGMSWCPKCPDFFNNPVQKAHIMAQGRNGEFLESSYLGAQIEHRWKCEQGHIFTKKFNDTVLRGRWCFECSGQKIDGLSIAHEYANKKGGQCLSDSYSNSQGRMLWQCHNTEHPPFEATYNCVVNLHRWCPKCAEFHIQEERVRQLLNNIFQTQFIKSRPDWNMNPNTGMLLELDGYSESLQIAFEYQGTQHFRNGFNKSDEEVFQQQQRDLIKIVNCEKRGVKLLVVMSSRSNDNYQSTMKHILNAIKKTGIILQDNPLANPENELIYNSTNNNVTDDRLKLAQEYAKNNNGQCLTPYYINAREPMEWKCDNPEHPSWFRHFESSVLGKRWCPYCKIRKDGRAIKNISNNVFGNFKRK